MVAFDEILRLIEQSIRGLVFNDPPKSLFEPVTYTLSLGGKRIRPALTLMAYNIYKEDVASALDVAMGLEVFHNFTLLHDDLMDEADMRRGQPTVHKVWGANTAILSGDAMLIAAYRLVAKADKVHLNLLWICSLKLPLKYAEANNMIWSSRKGMMWLRKSILR